MTITWIDDNDDIIADIIEILEKYIESSKDRNKKDIDYIYIFLEQWAKKFGGSMILDRPFWQRQVPSLCVVEQKSSTVLLCA